MTPLREAAQQALEFIRWSQFIPCQSEPFPEPPSTAPQVEAALRAALAEPPPHQYPLQSDRMRIDPVTGDVSIGTPQRPTEPVQEPVAWADEIIDDLHAQYNTDGIKEIDSGDALIRLDEAIAAVEEAEKRHIAPPQRKPLTEEEIQAAWDSVDMRHPRGNETRIAFARAIERAHQIGEQP